MKLSIVIPAYNEEKTIKELLGLVKKAKIGDIKKEIIVVDDGSIDNTLKILREIDEIKLISHKKNSGKGAATRTGIKHATGDIIIIQDADLEYNPDDYGKLIEPILQKKEKVVYGSRLLNKKKAKYSKFSFFVGGKIMTIATNLLYPSAKLTDEPTCYKVFRSDILKNIDLKCKRFEFCPEVTAKVLKKGIRIKEIPISYYPRSVKEGKKINWKDGLEGVWTLLKYRFIN